MKKSSLELIFKVFVGLFAVTHALPLSELRTIGRFDGKLIETKVKQLEGSDDVVPAQLTAAQINEAAGVKDDEKLTKKQAQELRQETVQDDDEDEHEDKAEKKPRGEKLMMSQGDIAKMIAKYAAEATEEPEKEEPKKAMIEKSTMAERALSADAVAFKWPHNTVYYNFADSVTEPEKEKILAALTTLGNDLGGSADDPDQPCITFTPATPGNRYVTFRTDGPGCTSNIGYYPEGDMNEINLSEDGCTNDAGVIMHEVIHTLGFFHEMARSDRNQYIDVDLDNVKPEFIHNFDKYDDDQVNDFGLPYDFLSLMHYGGTGFGMVDMSGKAMRTITTIDPTKQSIIGSTHVVSSADKEKIRRLYGCSARNEDGQFPDWTWAPTASPTEIPDRSCTDFEGSWCSEKISEAQAGMDPCSKNSVWFMSGDGPYPSSNRFPVWCPQSCNKCNRCINYVCPSGYENNAGSWQSYGNSVGACCDECPAGSCLKQEYDRCLPEREGDCESPATCEKNSVWGGWTCEKPYDCTKWYEEEFLRCGIDGQLNEAAKAVLNPDHETCCAPKPLTCTRWLELNPSGCGAGSLAQGEEDTIAEDYDTCCSAEGFRGCEIWHVPRHSLKECDNCLDSVQCPGDMFCCPYMKKCVRSSSVGCFPPVAYCMNDTWKGTEGCFDGTDPYECKCHDPWGKKDEEHQFPKTWLGNCEHFGHCRSTAHFDTVEEQEVGAAACGAFLDDETCSVQTDCAWNAPGVATCVDGIKNGDEEGIDCGGYHCRECPSCHDMRLNNEEQKIDCGGPNCAPCPTCKDNIRNQGEMRVDCGGPCEPCPGNCTDGILNRDELNIDCGGTFCQGCNACMKVDGRAATHTGFGNTNFHNLPTYRFLEDGSVDYFVDFETCKLIVHATCISDDYTAELYAPALVNYTAFINDYRDECYNRWKYTEQEFPAKVNGVEHYANGGNSFCFGATEMESAPEVPPENRYSACMFEAMFKCGPPAVGQMFKDGITAEHECGTDAPCADGVCFNYVCGENVHSSTTVGTKYAFKSGKTATTPCSEETCFDECFEVVCGSKPLYWDKVFAYKSGKSAESPCAEESCREECFEMICGDRHTGWTDANYAYKAGKSKYTLCTADASVSYPCREECFDTVCGSAPNGLALQDGNTEATVCLVCHDECFTVVCGEPPVGLSFLAGKDADSACASDPCGAEECFAAASCETLTVKIVTKSYGNEVRWHIDNEPEFGENPQYSRNSQYTEHVCLDSGEHTLYYRDTWGDGWHGGSIEVVGYVAAEKVEGYGGSQKFTTGPPGEATGSEPTTEEPTEAADDGGYTKFTGHNCGGSGGDLLRFWDGTAAECKVKCTELGCPGFVHVNSGTYSGDCFFRGGTLSTPSAYAHDDRDCYVPN